MIYTCYEMAQDCRADRPEGWRHLVRNYVPVMRKLAAHYGCAEAALNRLLEKAREPQSGLLAALEPGPERVFVAALRQVLLAEAVPAASGEPEISLAEVAAALEPLTLTEKQAAWMETMAYGPSETGVMLRMAPPTVEKIRGRAAELLRARMDRWRRTLLADYGYQLGREAASGLGKECPAAKVFLDVLDGRTPWRGREEMERHVTGCWPCIDYYCRLSEAIELLRGVEPMAEGDAAPYLKLLGVESRRRGWKTLLGGAKS